MDEDVFPEASGAYAWTAALNKLDLYEGSDYTPAAGDLVFFDTNKDGKADHVGVVTAVTETNLTAVEGDSNDKVEKNDYKLTDSTILGYGALPEQTESAAKDETETYTAADGDVTVTVTAPEGALPEGAELSVTLFDESSEEYAAAGETVAYDAADEDTGMAAMDISFTVNGVEVEPTEAVTVSIDASALLPEDANAESIEVQHLTETDDGVEATLVADASADTAGTVDAETATVEFEVESFSTFTIKWVTTSGITETNVWSVTATNYLLSAGTTTGTTTYSTLSSNVNVSYTTVSGSTGDTIYLTDSNASLSISGYTLEYATITYSGNTHTATAITLTTGTSGSNTTYTVTYIDADGKEQTLVLDATSSPSVSVSLYYVVTPTITITATEATGGYTLTATTEGTYSYSSLKWSVSDESLATITTNGDGTATVTWSDTAETGDTVTVTVTGTYTDVYGNTQTVTSTYTLTYNLASYTISVTYGTSNTSVGAGVKVGFYDSDGNLVATGTTNYNGQVTVNLVAGQTYTVKAAYKVTSSSSGQGPGQSSTTAYEYNGSFTAPTNTETGTINLASTTSYEHIDIKNSVVSSDGESETEIGTIISVVIYDGAGNVEYTSSGVKWNDDGNNWQSIYEGDHSIAFLTSYTVVISYTIEGDSTVYTATFDSSSVYPEGSYYPADGSNAYKLYNYLYGTSYTSNNSITDPIDISGMSIYLVASILCDSSSVTGQGTVTGSTQWGMDFALSVETLIANGANFNLKVLKTYTGGAMDAGMFTFYLYSATQTTVDDTSYWVLGDWIETETNSATTDEDADGTTTDSIDFSRIAYSTSDAGQTYYYVIYEENGGTTVNGIEYDGTIYGVAVTITTTTSTTGTVTTTNTVVSATYYTLTADGTDDGNTLYTAKQIYTVTESSDGEAIFPFTNTYTAEETTTDLTIVKLEEGTDTHYLAGAEFYLYYIDVETIYYYSYDENTGTVEWVANVSSATKITSVANASGVTVSNLSLGTYYLEEVTAPDGYNLLSEPIQFELDEYGLTIILENVDYSADEDDEDEDGNPVLYVYNSKGYELPSTGGSGTWMYTLAGLTLCGGAALLLLRKRWLA
ncbi:MAG: CHAP domain-containing protein [Clostridiales bacterium]|nr:CHAP domain-containing protein [Clostridiales bacterium]